MSSAIVSVPKSRVDPRLFSAAASVAISAGLVKLVAVIKESVVAGFYARSDALEAFLVAALIPALLVNLISESMNQALIPALVQARERGGRSRAQRLFSNALFSSVVLLVLGSGMTACLAGHIFPLIGFRFPDAKLHLAVQLFYALTPMIILTGMASTCSAVLNTEDCFTIPAIAPVVMSTAIILGVPIFNRHSGIWALAYASVVGALIHAAWIGWVTNRRGYCTSLRWHGLDEDTRNLARQCWPVMLSSMVASGGLVVDQSMAAMLAAGSVSALAYAGRFVSVALTLLGGSLAAAVTPFFSEMIARGDWNGCRKLLRAWTIGSFALASVCAAGLVIGARFLVQVAFQHGRFVSQDASSVASVLTMYALQIPFFVSSRVLYRFLIAMRRTDLVLYCGLINLVLDVFLNLVLMHRMGVAGIALSTSVWSVATLVFLAYWTWKVLPLDVKDRPNLCG